LDSSKDINAKDVSNLLSDHFHLPFPAQLIKGFYKNRKIYFYFKNGKWCLNIPKITESIIKHSACHLPSSNPDWTDIIHSFINKINDSFFTEFYKSIQNKSALNLLQDRKIFDKNSIPAMFFENIKYYGDNIDVLNLIVVHKMRHKPPSIYETFEFYAHKQYTLLGFVLNTVSFNIEYFFHNGIKSMLEEGKKSAIDAIHKCYTNTEEQKQKRNSNSKFDDLINETLESVQEDNNKYVPTELNIFIKQFRNQLIRIKKNDNPVFSKAQQRTINSRIKEMINYVNNPKDKADLQELMVEGRFDEKIILLYRLIGEPSVKRNLTPLKLKNIQKLYDKQMMYEVSGGGYIDNIGINKKEVDPSDHLYWTSVFKDELKSSFRDEIKKEFDTDKKWESFFEYITENIPFEGNMNGDLVINNKANKLFEIFCQHVGINTCDEFKKHFLISIQIIIDKFNKMKKDLRSKR